MGKMGLFYTIISFLSSFTSIVYVNGYILCHCNTIECQAAGTKECRAEYYCYRVFRLDPTKLSNSVLLSRGCVTEDHLDMCDTRRSIRNRLFTECCRDAWCNAIDETNQIGQIESEHSLRRNEEMGITRTAGQNVDHRPTVKLDLRTPTYIIIGATIFLVAIGLMISVLACLRQRKSKVQPGRDRKEVIRIHGQSGNRIPWSVRKPVTIASDPVQKNTENAEWRTMYCLPDPKAQADDQPQVTYYENGSGSPYASGHDSNMQTYDEPWIAKESDTDKLDRLQHTNKQILNAQKTSQWIKRQQELTHQGTRQLTLDTQRSHSSQRNDVTDSSELSGRISCNQNEMCAPIAHTGETERTTLGSSGSQRSHGSEQRVYNSLNGQIPNNRFIEKNRDPGFQMFRPQNRKPSMNGADHELSRRGETDKSVRFTMENACQNDSNRTQDGVPQAFTAFTQFRRADEDVELVTPYAQVELLRD